MKDHHYAFPVFLFLRGRTQSLRQMRRQWMIGGLIEEGGFLGGRFQKLLVLGIDVVAELLWSRVIHAVRSMQATGTFFGKVTSSRAPVAIAASTPARFHFGISSYNSQSARLRTLSTREQPWESKR